MHSYGILNPSPLCSGLFGAALLTRIESGVVGRFFSPLRILFASSWLQIWLTYCCSQTFLRTLFNLCSNKPHLTHALIIESSFSWSGYLTEDIYNLSFHLSIALVVLHYKRCVCVGGVYVGFFVSNHLRVFYNFLMVSFLTHWLGKYCLISICCWIS